MGNADRLQEALRRLDDATDHAARLVERGIYVEAEDLQKRVLEENIGLRGPYSKATLMAKGQLANTLWCQGHYSRAADMQTKLAGLFERHLGWNDADTHIMIGQLVMTYQSQYRHQEAKDLAARLLEKQGDFFGENSSEVLDTQARLAQIMHAQGDYREALETRHDVLKQRQRRTETDEPWKLAKALEAYARSLVKVNSADEATAPLEKALTIYQASLGCDNPETLAGKAQLAHLLYKQGRYSDAVQVGSEVLEVQGRVLGRTHPETICSMRDQAVYLWHACQRGKSKRQIDRAVRLSRKYLGDDNADTMSIKSIASTLYGAMSFSRHERRMSPHSFGSGRMLRRTDHPKTLSTVANRC